MTDLTSVAEAIEAKIATYGLLPEGSVTAHVHYVAIAKVTVLDVDGTHRTSFELFDNMDQDHHGRLNLARQLVADTEQAAG